MKGGEYSGEGYLNLEVPESIESLSIEGEEGGEGEEEIVAKINLETEWEEKLERVKFLEMSKGTGKLKIERIELKNFKINELEQKYNNSSMIFSSYNATEVTIKNCIIKNSNARIIYISPNNLNFTIKNCSFLNLSVFGSRYNILFPSIQIGDYSVAGNKNTAILIDSISFSNPLVDSDGPFIFVSGAFHLNVSSSSFVHSRSKFSSLYIDSFFDSLPHSSASSPLSPSSSSFHSTEEISSPLFSDDYQVVIDHCLFSNLSARIIGRPSGSAMDIRFQNQIFFFLIPKNM